MVHQIESGLYQRSGKAVTNFKTTITDEQTELVQQMLKDPFKLEFISLGEEAKERDLEEALMTHLTKLLLELGEGFTFKARQFRLQGGEQEYFIDLLFFNTQIKRYLVVELKIGEFKAEYVGKMNLYLTLIDEHFKDEQQEPAIGLILCRTKDKIVAEYALRDTKKPIGIAEYRIHEQLPDNIKGSLPSVEELEAEIEKGYEELKNPSEKKMDRVKELMKKLKQEKLSEKKSNEKTLYLFRNVFKTQVEMFWAEIKKEILPLFQNNRRNWRVESHGYGKYKEAEDQLLKFPTSYEFGFEVDLQGFKQAGVKTFSCSIGFKFYLDHYHYQVQDRNSQSKFIWRKLYHQNPLHEEMMEVVEHYKFDLLDQIEKNLVRITEEENG
jgi:predicted nuclease of restriction endonuclease-like (RecB) superfamily